MKRKCEGCGVKAQRIVTVDDVQHVLCEVCAIKITVDATIKGKNVSITGFNSSKMLTIGETAVLLNLHSNTIRRWGDLGYLKAYRLGPRGDRRFDRDEVEKMLRRKPRREAGTSLS